MDSHSDDALLWLRGQRVDGDGRVDVHDSAAGAAGRVDDESRVSMQVERAAAGAEVVLISRLAGPSSEGEVSDSLACHAGLEAGEALQVGREDGEAAWFSC